MATVTTLIGGNIPGISGGPDSSVQTILISTGTVFDWTSPDGHRITIIGSFTYSGPGTAPISGTVTEMRYDYGNDSTEDMTVDYGASPIAIDPDMFGSNPFTFHRTWFVQADNMTLAGTPTGGTIPVFAADGTTGLSAADTLLITGAGHFSGDTNNTTPDGSTFADDQITINSSLGAVLAFGDSYQMSGNVSTPVTVTMGADTIIDNSPDTDLVHILVGDVYSTNTNQPLYTIHGGDDTLTGTLNSVQITGDVSSVSGDDTTINGGVDTITGSAQDDEIYGDMRSINANSDNSTLNGGNDIIDGGDGADEIFGDIGELSAGNVLVGGDDNIKGGGGADTIYGDYETINSGAILVSGGNDTISGGIGNDLLYGQEGNDTLNGNADDDTLYGGAGDDIMNGGTGADTFFGGADNDTMDGGGGTNDTVSFIESLGGVTLTLNGSSDATATGEGTDTIRNIENIIGSNHSDTLGGDAGNNIIEGGLGNDILNGGGGSQDRTSYVAATAGVTVNLSLTTQQDTIGAGLDTLVNFEGIIGSVYNDTLTGSSGSNVIEAGDGNDTLSGGDGADLLDGGADVDTASYAGSDAAVQVSLAAGTATGGHADGDVLTSIENLTGSSYDDILSGDGGINILTGEGGNDTLEGGAGADTMIGGSGNDTYIVDL